MGFAVARSTGGCNTFVDIENSLVDELEVEIELPSDEFLGELVERISVRPFGGTGPKIQNATREWDTDLVDIRVDSAGGTHSVLTTIRDFWPGLVGPFEVNASPNLVADRAELCGAASIELRVVRLELEGMVDATDGNGEARHG
jgi:hypothetical protein